MTKEKTEKFLIIILIILGSIVSFDIGNKILSAKNGQTRIEQQIVTEENTITSHNNDDNDKYYRVNINNKTQLTTKEMRETNRYIENLKYSLEDAGLTMFKFHSDIKLSFTIDKQGNIECCNIITSSGEQDIDNYVIKKVKSLNPYEPLPNFYRGNKMLVKISYGENKSGMENIPIND